MKVNALLGVLHTPVAADREFSETGVKPGGVPSQQLACWPRKVPRRERRTRRARVGPTRTNQRMVMACCSRSLFRIGLVGRWCSALWGGRRPGAYQLLCLRRANRSMPRSTRTSRDPVALRAQPKDLESQYPKRLAEVRATFAKSASRWPSSTATCRCPTASCRWPRAIRRNSPPRSTRDASRPSRLPRSRRARRPGRAPRVQE